MSSSVFLPFLLLHLLLLLLLTSLSPSCYHSCSHIHTLCVCVRVFVAWSFYSKISKIFKDNLFTLSVSAFQIQLYQFQHFRYNFKSTSIQKFMCWNIGTDYNLIRGLKTWYLNSVYIWFIKQWVLIAVVIQCQVEELLWTTIRKDIMWRILRFCPRICLKRLRKSVHTLGQPVTGLKFSPRTSQIQNRSVHLTMLFSMPYFMLKQNCLV
jgi:hypothetical protein